MRSSICAALVLVSWTAVAQDPLADAERAYAEGRFAEARRGYEDALATGELGPRSLARTHLGLALVAIEDGDRRRGETEVTIARAIDPTLALPPELPSELRERLESVAAPGLAVQVEDRADSLVVRLILPAALARSTVEVRGDRWTRRAPWEGAPLTFEPPFGPVEVRVLDAFGNRAALVEARAPTASSASASPSLSSASASVASSSSASASVASSPSASAMPTSASARSLPAPAPRTTSNLIESPWLWIALGAIVIGVGIAIGVSASGERYVLGAPVLQ